jgi:hypothetical protein
MNLAPPPKDGTLEELQEWCDSLYEFLKYPAFHVLRFVPRADAPGAIEGNIYYDEDDEKLKVYDSDSWNNAY